MNLTQEYNRKMLKIRMVSTSSGYYADDDGNVLGEMSCSESKEKALEQCCLQLLAWKNDFFNFDGKNRDSIEDKLLNSIICNCSSAAEIEMCIKPYIYDTTL